MMIHALLIGVGGGLLAMLALAAIFFVTAAISIGIAYLFRAVRWLCTMTYLKITGRI